MSCAHNNLNVSSHYKLTYLASGINDTKTLCHVNNYIATVLHLECMIFRDAAYSYYGSYY